jgi:hypothetical protein
LSYQGKYDGEIVGNPVVFFVRGFLAWIKIDVFFCQKLFLFQFLDKSKKVRLEKGLFCNAWREMSDKEDEVLTPAVRNTQLIVRISPKKVEIRKKNLSSKNEI